MMGPSQKPALDLSESWGGACRSPLGKEGGKWIVSVALVGATETEVMCTMDHFPATETGSKRKAFWGGLQQEPKPGPLDKDPGQGLHRKPRRGAPPPTCHLPCCGLPRMGLSQPPQGHHSACPKPVNRQGSPLLISQPGRWPPCPCPWPYAEMKAEPPVQGEAGLIVQ